MYGLSTLERKIAVLQQDEAMLQPREPDIYVDFEKHELHYKIYNADTGKLVDFNYKPFPTTLAFHKDKSLVKAIMGPFGSGKSSACLTEIIFHASGMPPCSDGIRHARVAIVRNTYDMLKDTTLVSWKLWFENLGQVHETQKPIRLNLKYTDQLGKVDLSLVFLAMDKPGQMKYLFSNEFSMAYYNECQFIEEDAVGLMVPRVGRYPKKDFIINPENRRFKQVIMDTNPPDEDHWFYRWFEIDKDSDYKIFKQPTGILQDKQGHWYDNPSRENNDGLDLTYYADSAKQKSREWIKVYCEGKYGLMKDGKLVHPSFNSDLHVSVDQITPNPRLPLYFGWDFGLTPACVITQIDAEGRKYTLHEVTSFDVDLIQMIENLVLPVMNTKFKGFKIATSFHDPAGYDAMQTNGESCHDILKRYGFNPDPTGKTGDSRRADDLEARIRAVNKTLDKIIGGKAAYILDGVNCPMLKKAFLKEYKYRRMLVGGSEPRYADKPEKNKFSHVIEAHHYFCVGIDEPVLREEFNNNSIPEFIGINQHAWGF